MGRVSTGRGVQGRHPPNRIGEWRIRRGLRLEDVARACQPPVSTSTIQALERGRSPVTPVWRERLGKIFDCRPDEVMMPDDGAAAAEAEIRRLLSDLDPAVRSRLLAEYGGAPGPIFEGAAADAPFLRVEINDNGNYQATLYFRPSRAAGK